MSVFIDTNILLRVAQPSHALSGSATRAILKLIESGEQMMVTPQIMAEFWNAATRPIANNGFGFSHRQAEDELKVIESFFFVLAESVEVYAEWKRIISVHGVTGVKSHDARLVAAMTVYGIPRILTFNGADFARYTAIEIISPQTTQ